MRSSEVGSRRREAIRALLITAVVRRRQRRRAARAAAAVLLLAGVASWLALRQPVAPGAPTPVVRGPEAAVAAPRVAVFGDDPSVLARLAVGGAPAMVQFLDDAGLVTLLQQDGRPASLVRSSGRVQVLPRVDDDWLALP